MPKAESKVSAIMDSAERMARAGGYRGFSFREVAKDVGIKGASVHYHFPTKGDLGAAIVRRYTERFLNSVGRADDPDITPDKLLEGYVDVFRRALNDDELMCLCGMFGAEIEDLPPPVADQTREFFHANIRWLQTVFGRLRDNNAMGDEKRRAALRFLALLEGAMIISRTMDDSTAFDSVVQGAFLGIS